MPVTKVKFLVRRSPDTITNKFMRAADLFREGEGVSIEEVAVISWKEGEILSQIRINTAMETLKQAYEEYGYDCFSIKQISEPYTEDE